MQGQAAIKNGAVAEANSSVVDLPDFNMKAVISAALQHDIVKNIEQTLHRSGSSSKAIARAPSKGQAVSRGGMAGCLDRVLC